MTRPSDCMLSDNLVERIAGQGLAEREHSFQGAPY